LYIDDSQDFILKRLSTQRIPTPTTVTSATPSCLQTSRADDKVVQSNNINLYIKNKGEEPIIQRVTEVIQ